MFMKPLFRMAPGAQMAFGMILMVTCWLWPFVAGLQATRPVEYLGMSPSYLPGAWLSLPAVIMSAGLAFAGLFRNNDPSPRPWVWRPMFQRA